MGAILQLRNISRTFGNTVALKDINMDFTEGQIYGLVGENGAGKSTLMKIISGIIPPNAGDIIYKGRKVRIPNPWYAREMGIVHIPQEIELVADLSVSENIFLGDWLAAPFVNWDKMRRRSKDVLASIGFPTLDPRSSVSTLTVGQRQIVQVAKAFLKSPQMLILDEPSAVLTPHEMETILQSVTRLRNQGVTIIYISHYIEEVLKLADTFVVLRDGELVDTLPKAEATRDTLVNLMTGKQLKAVGRRESSGSREIVLEVAGLSGPNFQEVDLGLQAGEILGLAGLVGSGKIEIGRVIFGLLRASDGRIKLRGHPFGRRSPRESIRNGLGLLPEDRKTQGLILPMTLRENITLPRMDRVARHGFLDRRLETAAAVEYIRELGIKVRGPDDLARDLSGGNQQKVSLAKWFFSQAAILILEEPTRGVDVISKAEIYQLMEDFVRRGGAILLISSELDEILTMSNRVLVINKSRICGRFERQELSKERILQCML